jgi:hypothetical protein
MGAIFFEPFEAGNALLKFTYRRILSQASCRKDDAGHAFSNAWRGLPATRKTEIRPIYRELDDKWMFTRTFFDRARTEQGWSELITYTHQMFLRQDCATSGHGAFETGHGAEARRAAGVGVVDHR